MDDQITLRQWIENFQAGKYAAADADTQMDAGWYDWFCKDSSLVKKTARLAPKVKQIAKSPKVNIDTMYVFFKNNCPCFGALYDDFRICSIETGDVIYTITPASGYTAKSGKADVWGADNEFKEPLVEGSWDDVKRFFGV